MCGERGCVAVASPAAVRWVVSSTPSSLASRQVLFLGEDPILREAARRDLAPGMELLAAGSFGQALSLIDARPPPAAVLLDLGSPASRGMADFLATLVARDYTGPRILLSSRFRPEEAATLSQSSVIHFALATPWAAGELRAFVEAALGFRPFPGVLPPM